LKNDKEKKMKPHIFVLLIVALALIATLTGVACRGRAQPTSPPAQPVVASQPTVNITWPLNGARVRVGQQFQVHATATDPSGIARIAFATDGQVGTPATSASPLTTFSASYPVTLNTKGVHAISAMAFNASGTQSAPVTIRVVAVQKLSDPSAVGDPPPPAPQAPSGPPPPPPPDQPPAPSGASVNFTANPTSIQAGGCTTVRWDVEGVREVYFEGAGVTGHEERQMCPGQTTTYTLHVLFTDGSTQDYTATVNVSGVVEGPPPSEGGGGQPDLVVTGSFSEPAVQGQPFTASVTVTNRGDGAAGAFTVRWHFAPAAAGLADCNWDCPGLGAGQQWRDSCSRTPSGYGTIQSTLTADVEGEIGESNEGNNVASPSLNVAKAGGGGGIVPPRPENCTAQALSRTQVRIDWLQPASTPDGFRIYQGVTSLEQTAGRSARSAVIGNLAPNTQYHFDVRAYSAAGESPADACSVDVTTQP
jgi:hypothetical protein